MNEINVTPPHSSNYGDVIKQAHNDSANAGDSVMDVMHYCRLMMRNIWKIIWFSLFVGGLSVLYALSLPPVYVAKTVMLIENQRPNVLSLEDGSQVDALDRSYLRTQLEILKSRAIAERVVDRMRLIEHPVYRMEENISGAQNQFTVGAIKRLIFSFVSQNASSPPEMELPGEQLEVNSSVAPSGKRKYVVDQIIQSIAISPVHDTRLITIQASAGDPQLAADIANEFSEVYIESHLEASFEVIQKASAWLSDRLGGLRQALRESEQELQEFRQHKQLADTGDGRSIDVAELVQLRQSVVEANRVKKDAKVLHSQISESGLNVDRMLALPIFANHIDIQALVESRAVAKHVVAELGGRYGETHIKMLSALSDLSQVESELTSQVDSVARGLQISYRAAEDTERELKRQIANVKRRLENASRKEFFLRELEREVDDNTHVYKMFLNSTQSANEAAGLESVNARVIDVALPPDDSAKPEKKKIVMVAVFLSGLFAAGIILLLNWLDNTIKTPEDVEGKLKVPLLGYLPLDKSNKEETPFLGFLSENEWHFSEAARTIRTNYILSCLDRPAKVTVVTSTVPDEGKSTVSICLAHALGQMEKVLLIDADMRKSSIGNALGISLQTPGLSDLIDGTAGLEECVTRLPNSEVDIITAGVALGNPLDLIASDRFSLVINTLKEKYDRILIDSAPVLAVSDSIVIANHADALIYVVRSGDSSASLIKKGLRRLSATKARLSGVVLNQVDIEKMKKRSGHDSEFYNNYD